MSLLLKAEWENGWCIQIQYTIFLMKLQVFPRKSRRYLSTASLRKRTHAYQQSCDACDRDSESGADDEQQTAAAGNFGGFPGNLITDAEGEIRMKRCVTKGIFRSGKGNILRRIGECKDGE